MNSKSENTESIDVFLNTILTNERSLCLKTQSALQNLQAQEDNRLDALLDDQIKMISDIIRDVSNGINRDNAKIDLPDFQDGHEYSYELKRNFGFHNADEIVRNLLGDHESIIRAIQKYMNDLKGNISQSRGKFLDKIMKSHEILSDNLDKRLSSEVHITRMQKLKSQYIHK